jgi:nucleotide-binding universal stress UspA family protein
MKTIVFDAANSPSVDRNGFVPTEATNVAPIIAAVDASASSRTAVAEAVRLGLELDAPIVFVYVRSGPARFFGAPVYQRRLSRELARARQVLDRALAVAAGAGVRAEAEILEGRPKRRIAELARDRQARLVVVGSRKRKLGSGVSGAVVRGAGRPVVVARDSERPAVARRPGARRSSARPPSRAGKPARALP